jgi:hypothetical protein
VARTEDTRNAWKISVEIETAHVEDREEDGIITLS